MLLKNFGANGTTTSGLIYGGEPNTGTLDQTESWNGTNWTEVNNLNTSRFRLAGAGADNTSAIAIGGSPGPATTELWNGTNWTEVNDLNTGREDMGANGTATAALIFGGSSPARDETEEWNGASWSETSDLNTGRKELGAAKSGTSTSSLAFGGKHLLNRQQQKSGMFHQM